MRRSVAVPVLVLAASVLAVPAGASGGPLPGPVTDAGSPRAGRVLAAATLPDLPLPLPGARGDSAGQSPGGGDRGIDLGGIGSDLFPAEAPGEFWVTTDRGPNGLIAVDGVDRRTFPVPRFTPTVLRIAVVGETVEVREQIPLRDAAGRLLSGLPNQAGRDEVPWDHRAELRLDYDPAGVDTEGLVRAADGSFWLADEYAPSLLHVSAAGRVLARYVPRGSTLATDRYPVVPALPGILAARKLNRGFEGLALLGDGDLLAVVQSPLSVPDSAAGAVSRTTRLVRFSPSARRTVAEYGYRFDPVAEIDPSATLQGDVKSSAVVGIGGERVLVEERTDAAARLYAVDLAEAGDLYGSAWDDLATSPSLEQLDDPAGAGVRLPAKTPVVDLGVTPGVPRKIEGVAVLDASTLAIANDNDFGMTDGPAAFDADGTLVDSGVESRLVTVRLPVPLTGARG